MTEMDPGVILDRIRATFDQPLTTDERWLLQTVLDEEGPEALIDAVLTAAAGSATPQD